MTKKVPTPRTNDTQTEWADPGLPIGSPNDPAIGEARDQNTGPGGDGLRSERKNSAGVSEPKPART